MSEPKAQEYTARLTLREATYICHKYQGAIDEQGRSLYLSFKRVGSLLPGQPTMADVTIMAGPVYPRADRQCILRRHNFHPTED